MNYWLTTNLLLMNYQLIGRVRLRHRRQLLDDDSLRAARDGVHDARRRARRHLHRARRVRQLQPQREAVPARLLPDEPPRRQAHNVIIRVYDS